MSVIYFTKMQGLGNDFVVIDTITQQVEITSALVRNMSDRHRGIGCDQLLLLQASEGPQADFVYRIFNADGTEVEQCGNGARCVARYLVKNKLTDKTSFTLQTAKGAITVEVHNDESVTVCMGKPLKLNKKQTLVLEGQSYDYVFVDVGNPHMVIFDAKVDDIAGVGEALSRHSQFSGGVNVSFIQSISPDIIDVIVYERGAGLTEACGSAACAVAAAVHSQGSIGERVTVVQPGGQLSIFSGLDGAIFMQGPAEFVFKGEWPCSFEC